MAVACSGIAVKKITSDRVFLSGTITGLSATKRYCIHYYSWDWKNVPRSGTDYTYISGKTSFDLGAAGCYILTSVLNVGQQFEVACHEVERTCESIIEQACAKVLWYEVTEQRYVHFYARDDNNNPVENARIEIAGESFYTGSDGKAHRVFDAGTTYYARGYAPSGYECVDCYESFYHDSDRVINFSMKVEEEPSPDVLTISAPTTAVQYKEFYVDVSGAPISREIHIYRNDPIWKDKSLGSGVAGGDGRTTIKCVTEVSGTIKIYGCYNPGLTKCEIESTRVSMIVSKEPVPDEPEMIISAPFSASQYEPFYVDVEFAPNKKVEIHREIPLWKDTVLGSATTGDDGRATIECITNVSGDINIYGCYNPGLLTCEVESPRSRIEITESIIDFRIESPESVTVKQTFPVDVYYNPSSPDQN